MGGMSSTCGCNDDKKQPIPPTIVKATQRENMATWHRTDIPVTDVYNIVETIGKGRMGEVYKVKRLVEDRGLHNHVTRTKSLDSSLHGSKPDITQYGKSPESTISPLTQQIIRDENSPPANTKIMPPPILRKASRGNLPSLTNSNPTLRARADSSNASSKELLDDQSLGRNSPDGSEFSIRSVTDRISSFIFDDNADDDMSVGSNISGADTPLKRSKKRRNRLRFQRNYACKTVSTVDIQMKELTEMMNEIYIMRTLDHPYIIRLYEVYQVKNKIWLVMDLCNGGNLTTRKLNESQVVVVAEQILRGVVYLHRHGVCHQDLKLENILYEHSGVDATIRLIDFGISAKYDHAQSLCAPGCGAAYTMSPEISSGTGPYTTKSDVWAIGVIVWVLLAGDYPFMKKDSDLNIRDKRIALNNADYDYGITWRGRDITSEAKRFVAGCLRKSPEKRWSAKQALSFVKESWVPGLEVKQMRLDDGSKRDLSTKKKTLEVNMSDIARFCECGLLKQTVLITMANTMDRGEVGDLQELFLLVDSENTGTISISELKEAFEKLGLPNLADKELNKIFSVIDHDHSGQIHYAEFLAALAESHGLVTLDRLADAFDRIDTNGKGFITHDDLKAILGENYRADVVDRMIEEGDFKKNGKIDYDELQQLMFGEEDLQNVGVEPKAVLMTVA